MKSTMLRRVPGSKAQTSSQRNQPFQRSRSGNGFDEYAARKYRKNPYEQRYDLNDNDNRWDDAEDYYEQHRSPYTEQYSRSDRNNGSPNRRERSYQFRNDYVSRYGEHPASLGPVEYLRSNKRRTGLGGERRSDFYSEPYQEENYYSNERRDQRNQGENRRYSDERSDYEIYMDRGQFENEFHGKDIYPPEGNYDYDRELSERNRGRLYKYDGYQSFGNIEGFGVRGGWQHGQDWEDEDEYRQGHAPRRIGHGKFGSR